MLCPNCEKYFDNNSKICPECGYKVGDISPSEIKSQKKDFFSILFSPSFKDFITPTLIKIYYIIGIVLTGLAIILLVFIYSKQDSKIGIVMAILSPIIFILSVIGLRAALEITMVFFKIEEYLREIKNKK